MTRYFLILFSFFVIATLSNCRTTKKINKAINTKDTVVVVPVKSNEDSILQIKKVMTSFNSHHINFKTFSAKIKAEYQDNDGKKPDVIAFVKIIKDSAIWMSLQSAFLSIEAFRLYVTPDSVILVNKLEKEVKYRSIEYLQEVTEIPFDFNTLQDLLVGNPIFVDSNVVSYKQTENHILVATVGKIFKHLLTLSPDDKKLLHSKLDDIDVSRNRTADITYSDFTNSPGFIFSTYREITVSEKNKLDIRLNYKQFEFNKPLSFTFNVQKNFKRT